MTWVRRARWWLLVPVVGAASVTIAAASTLSLTSKNLTVVKTCVLTGNPNTSTAVIDTAVKQDSAATNFGTATTIDVQSQSSNKNHRVYVKFDLTRCSPAIASTATVKIATLRLVMSGVPTNCRTQDLFKVTSTWAEGTVTWNTQPFGTSLNNPASGSASATATVGTSPCGFTAVGYVSWTVTTDVSSFVAGTSTNFGWMIRDDVENQSTTARTATYAAKDANVLAGSPQLVVTYTS
jgi:hypothetical protein